MHGILPTQTHVDAAKEKGVDDIAQLLQAHLLRLRGNDAFKARELERSLKLYTDAMRMVKCSLRPAGTGSVAPDAEFVAQLFCNRAGVLIEMKRAKDAAQDAQKAIDILPEWHRGYFRKGLALVSLSRSPSRGPPALSDRCTTHSR